MDPSVEVGRPPAAKSSNGPRHDDDVQLAGQKAATDGTTEGGREGSEASEQRAFNQSLLISILKLCHQGLKSKPVVKNFYFLKMILN